MSSPLPLTDASVLEPSFVASLCHFLWTRKAPGSTAAAHWTATHHFVHWLDKLLVRTATSEAIQLLALYIVYRLVKKTSVAGLPGSEYRLITVALSIANKVLEDNTYTIRTWSEVAGLDVETLNFGEREVLKALSYAVQPPEAEGWYEWLDRIGRWKVQRHEALSAQATLPPSPVMFDPSYSMLTLSPGARSRSQPGSPLRISTEVAGPPRRKRKADEAELWSDPLAPPNIRRSSELWHEQQPAVPAYRRASAVPLRSAEDSWSDPLGAPSIRRASAGAMAHQHPRHTPLFQAHLQQGYLRSASLSPSSAHTYAPFSPASVAASTPLSTPPFSPITYGYLTDRQYSPQVPAVPATMWHTALVTDPVTGHITTQLVAAPYMLPSASTPVVYSPLPLRPPSSGPPFA